MPEETTTQTQTTTQTKVAVTVAAGAIIAAAAAGFIGVGLDKKPFDPDKCLYGYKLVDSVKGYSTEYWTPGYYYDIPGYAQGYAPAVTISGYVPGYNIYDCIPGSGTPAGYNSGYNTPPGYTSKATLFEPHWEDEMQKKIEAFEKEVRGGFNFWDYFYQKTKTELNDELEIQKKKSSFLTKEQARLTQEITSADHRREQFGNKYYEAESKDLVKALELIKQEFVTIQYDTQYLLEELEILAKESKSLSAEALEEIGWLQAELNRFIDEQKKLNKRMEAFYQMNSLTKEQEKEWMSLERRINWVNRQLDRINDEIWTIKNGNSNDGFFDWIY